MGLPHDQRPATGRDPGHDLEQFTSAGSLCRQGIVRWTAVGKVLSLRAEAVNRGAAESERAGHAADFTTWATTKSHESVRNTATAGLNRQHPPVETKVAYEAGDTGDAMAA